MTAFNVILWKKRAKFCISKILNYFSFFHHEDGQTVTQRPKEAVDSPSLEVFTTWLDRSWANKIYMETAAQIYNCQFKDEIVSKAEEGFDPQPIDISGLWIKS